MREVGLLLNIGEQKTGGLTALLKWHTAFLQYLWVHPDHRNRGYGSMLVAELEREARKHHCTNIAVHTFDFMALEFYQKLGFHICGELPDAPRGHTYYWLRKPLT